jgi:uncharacterized membrane protein YGL010W
MLPFAQEKVPMASSGPERTLGGKPISVWIDEYGHSHQHPVNRMCHTFGIPMIALSLPLALVALVPWLTSALPVPAGFWKIPAALFLVGWILQFVGHAVEGEPPEFLKDWRFLFVGLRWWAKKVGLR